MSQRSSMSIPFYPSLPSVLRRSVACYYTNKQTPGVLSSVTVLSARHAYSSPTPPTNSPRNMSLQSLITMPSRSCKSSSHTHISHNLASTACASNTRHQPDHRMLVDLVSYLDLLSPRLWRNSHTSLKHWPRSTCAY